MAQKELGYVELEWTCPACNTRNAGTARKCTQCGAPQPAEVQFEQAAEEKIITDEARIAEAKAGPDLYCAYCGTRNPGTATVCKQCSAPLAEGKAREAGQVLGGLKTEPAAPVKCPSCGAENPATARSCARCGAPLGKATPPPPPTPGAKPGCLSPAVLIGIGAVILIAIVIFIVLGSRSKAVVGQVSDVYWKRTVAIEALRPVTRENWRDQIPAAAEIGDCRQQVRRTQNDPAPGAREVCGTAYVKDQGSGYGKVIQDCRYEILDDMCQYKALAWVVVPALVREGHDLAPAWPDQALGQDQRQAGRSEGYTVVFETDGRTYEYTPRNENEFRGFQPGSRWQLEVNGFGAVTGVTPD
jgi:ribosomal protein L40E